MKLSSTPQALWQGDEYGDGWDRRIIASVSDDHLVLERQVFDRTWQGLVGRLSIRNREQALAVRGAIDTYLGTQPVVSVTPPGLTAQEERDAVASVLAIVSVQLVAVVEAMSLLSDPSSEDAIRQGMVHASNLTGQDLGDCLAAIDKDLRDICTSLEPTHSWAQRQKLKAAWPLMQTAGDLANYCRTVNLYAVAGQDPDDERTCWQVEGWCLELVEMADRVSALLEGAIDAA